MPKSNSKEPRKWTRVLGVCIAICIGVFALLILLMTQEPKRAISSPVPAKAAIVPQIADAKSEAEIVFRGKSFSYLKRGAIARFSGEIQKIYKREGEAVEKDEILAEYKLDRQSMLNVQRILYPEMVLNLRKNQFDRKIQIEKIQNSTLPVKKSNLQQLEKQLGDLKEMASKGMAHEDAVKSKELQVQAERKAIFEIEETLKQQEADLLRVTEDLRFYEEKHRKDLDLLEWQAGRKYSDQSIPQDIAYIRAPIAGNVILVAPEAAEKAEISAGLQVMTLAPTNPVMVRCKVHELDLVKLHLGDRGTATFDAIPDKNYPCKITKIPWVSRNPALEVPADYDLECELDSADIRIKDGLTCNVRVTVTE